MCPGAPVIFSLANKKPECSIICRFSFLEVTVFKSFVVGMLVGVLVVMGGIYYYFASGMAPAATADAPMPFEKRMASKALNAHIDKATIPPPAVPADEPNFVAGAKVYKDQCAVCHGLPNQPKPAISDGMYPHAPMLFEGKGVTDDPSSETYWKAANGIRLTGMPSFRGALNDTQLWQVSQLLAHADKIPDSAKKLLVPEPPAAPSTAPAPAPVKALAVK
jgi:thiosulfate dehydrogenase